MTEKSYFGKQNSTLGSVVPLAMFYLSLINWSIYLLYINDTLQNMGMLVHAMATIAAQSHGKGFENPP